MRGRIPQKKVGSRPMNLHPWMCTRGERILIF